MFKTVMRFLFGLTCAPHLVSDLTRRFSPSTHFQCSVLLGFSLVTSAIVAPRHSHAEISCGIADSAIEAASSVRELTVKQKVKCLLQEKDEVKKFLIDTLDEKVPQKKLRSEAIAFRLTGIVSESFDYKNGIISLYTDQIGGYYDPKRDRYVMAAWLPEAMQFPIAIHELTHALQDQHFNLEKFSEDTSLSSDEMLARAAVVEGDAMAVMLDFSNQAYGAPPLAETQNVSSFMTQSVLGMTLTPSSDAAPTALKMMMIFPYISGLNYVHRALKADGYEGINKLYTSPPRSTAEILHPERARFSPRKVTPPPCKDTEIGTDTWGEFMISTLLGTFTSASSGIVAAQGWAGDLLRVCEGKDSEELIWTTEWMTPKDAAEFQSEAEVMFNKRFGEPTGPLGWTQGRFQSKISREGLAVTIRITRRTGE